MACVFVLVLLVRVGAVVYFVTPVEAAMVEPAVMVVVVAILVLVGVDPNGEIPLEVGTDAHTLKPA